MPHYFYIIYSKTVGSYYLGETSNLDQRLDYHNNKPNSKGFSKLANDWEYVLKFECENSNIAKKLERFVKNQKSKNFNKRIIEDNSILIDLIKNKI